MTEFLILIPSLDPDEKIINVVSDLKLVGFSRFLIINDGSVSSDYFMQLEKEHDCTILTHEVNRGKGMALKTGFEYAKTMNHISYIITVDGDYQHKAKDVLFIAKTLEQCNENVIVLGVRNFSKHAGIPFRSWFGNQISAFTLGLITGKKLQDSQTGLRGFSSSILDKMIGIEGERFEYETNVLLHIRKMACKLIEIPIETVYIEENESSHFHPIRDSLKVFSVIIKFIGSSCISALVDISVFSSMVYLFFHDDIAAENIFLASVIARLISSAVNFTLNYNTVFNSEENLKVALAKYYSLAFILMVISSFATGILTELSGLPVPIKLAVDGTIFFLSYSMQKSYIFRRKDK